MLARNRINLALSTDDSPDFFCRHITVVATLQDGIWIRFHAVNLAEVRMEAAYSLVEGVMNVSSIPSTDVTAQLDE